jgi:hypothetical protein
MTTASAQPTQAPASAATVSSTAAPLKKKDPLPEYKVRSSLSVYQQR